LLGNAISDVHAGSCANATLVLRWNILGWDVRHKNPFIGWRSLGKGVHGDILKGKLGGKVTKTVLR
jgi:hypothetical protein